MTLSDSYAILGVNPDTPFPAIQKRFRSLSNRFHPDKNNDYAAYYNLLTKAYDVVKKENAPKEKQSSRMDQEVHDCLISLVLANASHLPPDSTSMRPFLVLLIRQAQQALATSKEHIRKLTKQKQAAETLQNNATEEFIQDSAAIIISATQDELAKHNEKKTVLEMACRKIKDAIDDDVLSFLTAISPVDTSNSDNRIPGADS